MRSNLEVVACEISLFHVGSFCFCVCKPERTNFYLYLDQRLWWQVVFWGQLQLLCSTFCFCLAKQKEVEKSLCFYFFLSSYNHLLFFDFEATQEHGTHRPNLCVVHDEERERWHYFKAKIP